MALEWGEDADCIAPWDAEENEMERIYTQVYDGDGDVFVLFHVLGLETKKQFKQDTAQKQDKCIAFAGRWDSVALLRWKQV